MSPLILPPAGISLDQTDARYAKRVADMTALKALSGSDLTGMAHISRYYSGTSGGENKYLWDSNFTAKAFTVDANQDTFLPTSYPRLLAGRKVKFYGGSLPPEISAGTTYYATFIMAVYRSGVYATGQKASYGGRIYEATTGGTAATTVPGTLGTTSTGGTVADGTVTWTDRGAAPSSTNQPFQVSTTFYEAIKNPSTHVNISTGSGNVNLADDGGIIIEANSNPQDGRWVNTKHNAEEWSVADFGVSPNFGGDYTPQWKLACEARSAWGGGNLKIPAGVHFVTGDIYKPQNVHFIGDGGPRATWINHTGDNKCFWTDGNSFTLQGIGGQDRPGGMEKLTISCAAPTNVNAVGTYVYEGSKHLYKEVQWNNYRAGHGVVLDQNVPYALTLGSEGMHFYKCEWSSNAVHFRLKNSRVSDPASYSDLRMTGAKFDAANPNERFIQVDNLCGWYAGQCEAKFQSTTIATSTTAFYLDGSGLGGSPYLDRAQIEFCEFNCYFENKNASDVYVRMADYDLFNGHGRIFNANRAQFIVPTHAYFQIEHPVPSWDRGDVALSGANALEELFNHRWQYVNTPLTANRIWNLPPTHAMYPGETWIFERGPAATGLFYIDIQSSTGTSITRLKSPRTIVEIMWDGSGWRLKHPKQVAGASFVNEARNLIMHPDQWISWGVSGTDRVKWGGALYFMPASPNLGSSNYQTISWASIGTNGGAPFMSTTAGQWTTGGADQHDTTTGISITGWYGLWALFARGGATASGWRLRVGGYDFGSFPEYADDDNAILIANRNATTGNLHLRNGTVLRPGEVWRALPGTPVAAAGAAAGTTPPTPTLTGANKDQAGTISITTGTGTPTAGVYATITFNQPYGVAPIVTISPLDAASAARQVYATATTSVLTIGFGAAGAASTTYQFAYRVGVGQ